MRLDPADEVSSISRSRRSLYVAAAGLTFILLVVGGVVCVTDASGGCPDWPACYGQLVPPGRLDSILEYTHRAFAGVTGLSIVASALVGWRNRRSSPWLSWPPAAAVIFLLIVATLGAMVVLRGIGPGLAALDLGSALLVMALTLVPPVVAYSRGHRGARLSVRSAYARLTLSAAVSVFIVLVSAVLVADPGSATRCLGWPVASARLLRGDLRGWLQVARYAAGVLTALLLVTAVVWTWRTRRRQPAMRVAIGVAIILALEIALGASLGWISALWVSAIYALLATGLWSLVVVLALLAGFEEQSHY
jgi:cytochrome c oxidase assembly protein subunit 15